MRDYVRDYHQQFAFYRHLPDMAAKEPYVLRLSLAETEPDLLTVLFGDHSTASEPTPIPQGSASSLRAADA